MRNISAIHYEPDALYFFTARGKDFCQELLADGRVQILGYTKYKEMIRLSARAVPLPEEEQAPWIHRIFAEQPYLANVYPRNTREIGLVFAIRAGGNPVLPPGSQPHLPGHLRLWGAAPSTPKGYEITEDCLACGLCLDPCPPGLHPAGGTLCDPAGTLPPLRQLPGALPGKGGPPRTAATQD